MKTIIVLLLALVLLRVEQGTADDIDALLPAVEESGAYLNVLVDTGDSQQNTTLCTFGADCAPPFMSVPAYKYLQTMYFPGEKVTAPGVFKAVLAAVLEYPLFDSLRLSLMISNHQGGTSEGFAQDAGGGTIIHGYKSLGDSRESLINTLTSIPDVSSGYAHPLQPMESYFEWSRYLRGGDVVQGNQTSGNFGELEPFPNFDSGIIDGREYVSPFLNPYACPDLYSLVLATALPAQDNDLNPAIVSQVPLPGNATLEDMLAYLHDESTDLLPHLVAGISLQKTYVVTSREQSDRVTAKFGSHGSDVMYVDDPNQLQQNLFAALNQMMGRGRGDSAANYARDVYNPGTALGSVFIPLFRSSSSGIWQGNIKKLKFQGAVETSENGDVIGDGAFDTVVDAHGKPAFEVSGEHQGLLRFDALTFWTDPATLPPGDGIVLPKNADGRVVARGGAGQKIDGFARYVSTDMETVEYIIGDTNSDMAMDGFTARQIFFEPNAGSQLQPFDANQTTADVLRNLLDADGELSTEQLLDLIRWGRGQDVRQEQAGARPWLLGEILHSRPYVLNYGATSGYSKSNPNIRLLFGSGDGLFHIIENTDAAGNETGREMFGFYPVESLSKLKQRYENSAPPGVPHYGVDGAPAVLRLDKNSDGTLDYQSGDKAYVYFGLRRGGAAYYAMDITNPDARPELLWKISRTVGGSFDELGMTFSTPVVGKINYSGVALDVVIFAGGYDGGWSSDYTSRRGKDLNAADNSLGNALYIVNAHTGELVWKAVKGTTGYSTNSHYEHAGLVDSIPSTVTAMVGAQGVIHRLYVGDTGGAVWRVDLPENVAGSKDYRRRRWFITKLADLGRDALESGGDVSTDRRFFHPLDIVSSVDSIGDFDGVLIQSGDRAHPNEKQVANALFYIKDRQITSGSPVVSAENEVSNPPGRYLPVDLVDQTSCIAGTEAAAGLEGAKTCGDSQLENGWKIAYTNAGEKGLSAPLVDGGRVFASTYIAGDTTACPVRQGQGRMHVVRLKDGTAVANNKRFYDLGPGIPDAAMPVGDAIYLPGAGLDLYDLDGDGTRDLSKLLPSQAGKVYSIYWREPGIDSL